MNTTGPLPTAGATFPAACRRSVDRPEPVRSPGAPTYYHRRSRGRWPILGNHTGQSAHSVVASMKCHVKCRSQLEVRQLLACSSHCVVTRQDTGGMNQQADAGDQKVSPVHILKVLPCLMTPVRTID